MKKCYDINGSNRKHNHKRKGMHPHHLMEHVRLGRFKLPLNIRLTIKRKNEPITVVDGTWVKLVDRSVVLQDGHATFQLSDISSIHVQTNELHLLAIVHRFFRSCVKIQSVPQTKTALV